MKPGKDIPFHAYANIFPLMEGEPFDELVADIRENGQIEPIDLFGGEILDGRNRYRACRAAGIEPKILKYSGTPDEALAHVVSKNAKRRHLNESQRAICAAELAKIFTSQDDGGAKSAAAAERWSRAREMKEIFASEGSFAAKQELAWALEAQWAKQGRSNIQRAMRQLYVAVAGDRMKVGISTFPDARVKTLRSSVPGLELLETWPASYPDEKQVHRLLAKVSLGHEWFTHSERAIQIVGEYMQHRQLAEVHINANESASSLMNIGVRSIERASVVLSRGSPELIAVVKQGQLPVSGAVVASKLSIDVQRKIATEAKQDRANVVRSILKKEGRKARETTLAAKQLALPDQKYGVIYADPEWRFEPRSRETGMDRAADQHYPTSATADIAARDVASIAADDCVLWLWATAPMIEDALHVMKAWGFEYKAQCIWNKLRSGDARGTGYWFTGEHELLLVGTRGNVPAPAPGTQWRSVVTASVGEHSEKPEVFHRLIEEYFPTLPRIELNARRARDGWDVWGDEVAEAASAA